MLALSVNQIMYPKVATMQQIRVIINGKLFPQKRRRREMSSRKNWSESCDVMKESETNNSGFKKKCPICLDVYTLEVS